MQQVEIDREQASARPDDPPAQDEPIKRLLERSRSVLVDPTRNNRLINAPLKGKRPWCLAVEGQTADEVLEKLHRDDGFKGYAFGSAKDGRAVDRQDGLPLALPAPETAGAPVERTSASARPTLQTSLTADKLDKRLTKIFREERTLEEEQGLSTLFLAAGFLKWFDANHSDIAAYAPLILIPVTLKRVQAKEGYVLVGRDCEVAWNKDPAFGVICIQSGPRS